jgi:Rrf2 family transcriptional regulator, cysteine metabolism repressor
VRLSARARYAIRFMLELSLRFDDPNPVAMSVVAKRASISKPYLDQLAMALRHANLIRGRAGRRGGYVLSRAPKDILLREIVEAVIGEVNVTECVADPGVCARSEFCACRQVWQEINTRIRSVLDDYTLEELTHHEQQHGQRKGGAEAKLVKLGTPPSTSADREASQA